MNTNNFKYTRTVPHEWVDFNGHMNNVEYSRVFSDATDDWLVKLGFTREDLEKFSFTIFTLENHIRFLKELEESEQITIDGHIYDYDEKKLHMFMHLYNANQEISATCETMFIGIDLKTRRSAPFPDKIYKHIQDYYKHQDKDYNKDGVGSTIGIRRK